MGTNQYASCLLIDFNMLFLYDKQGDVLEAFTMYVDNRSIGMFADGLCRGRNSVRT